MLDGESGYSQLTEKNEVSRHWTERKGAKSSLWWREREMSEIEAKVEVKAEEEVETTATLTPPPPQDSNGNEQAEQQQLGHGMAQGHFSSEIYKIEIANIPKVVGYSELKKYLAKMKIKERRAQYIAFFAFYSQTTLIWRYSTQKR